MSNRNFKVTVDGVSMQATINMLDNVVTVVIGESNDIKINFIANNNVAGTALVNDVLEGVLEKGKVNALINKYDLFRIDIITTTYDISVCRNHIMMQMNDFTVDVNNGFNNKLTALISKEASKVVSVITAKGMNWYVNGSAKMNHLICIRYTNNNGVVLGYAGELNHVRIQDTVLANILSSNRALTVDVVQKIEDETSDFEFAEIVGASEDGIWQCKCYHKGKNEIKNIAA